MPRDGSGGYTLVAGNPVVTGTAISSTVQNNTMNDVASALTASIASDGQTTPSANLKMGGFKHINVANASSRISSNANYAAAADVQDGTGVYLTGPAGTNTVTASAAWGLAAYVTGQIFTFIPALVNTGATTININSVGAKNIFYNGAACTGGELRPLIPVTIEYDGTQFNIIANGDAYARYDADKFLFVDPIDKTRRTQFTAANVPAATTNQLAAPIISGTLALTSDIRDYISGFTLTNNGTTTYDIAAGSATDSTNTATLSGSAITAKSQAAWVAGSSQGGKLSAAAMANNTLYYWFALWKTVDGTVDYGFDVSTTPTLPSGYTKYRYIGFRWTASGSTNWVTIWQHGDECTFDVPPALDLNGAVTTASRTLQSVKVGAVRVKWKGYFQTAVTGTQASFLFFTDPLMTDTAAGNTVTPLGQGFAQASGVAQVTGQYVECWTNTSSQIGVRGTIAATTQIQTLGWYDLRGKPV